MRDVVFRFSGDERLEVVVAEHGIIRRMCDQGDKAIGQMCRGDGLFVELMGDLVLLTVGDLEADLRVDQGRPPMAATSTSFR